MSQTCILWKFTCWMVSSTSYTCKFVRYMIVVDHYSMCQCCSTQTSRGRRGDEIPLQRLHRISAEHQPSRRWGEDQPRGSRAIWTEWEKWARETGWRTWSTYWLFQVHRSLYQLPSRTELNWNGTLGKRERDTDTEYFLPISLYKLQSLWVRLRLCLCMSRINLEWGGHESTLVVLKEIFWIHWKYQSRLRNLIRSEVWSHVYFAQHWPCFFLPLPHVLVRIQNAAATRKKRKKKTLACIREIQVHKLWTKVYSQKGLTAILSLKLLQHWNTLHLPKGITFLVSFII